MYAEKSDLIVPIVGSIVCLVLILFLSVILDRSDKAPDSNMSREGLNRSYQVVCLDGYEYLYLNISTRGFPSVVLATRFDPLTDKPKKCSP
jgi:hypothetical protein